MVVVYGYVVVVVGYLVVVVYGYPVVVVDVDVDDWFCADELFSVSIRIGKTRVRPIMLQRKGFLQEFSLTGGLYLSLSVCLKDNISCFQCNSDA